MSSDPKRGEPFEGEGQSRQSWGEAMKRIAPVRLCTYCMNGFKASMPLDVCQACALEMIEDADEEQ